MLRLYAFVSNALTSVQGWTKKSLIKSKKYLIKFSKKYSQELAGMQMASKVIAVVALFALIPVTNVQAHREQYKTAIKFDQTKPFALEASDRKVALETGSSTLDTQSVAVHRQLAYATTSDYQTRERSPEEFDGLYQSASSQFGVPWQLLKAVHYVESGCSDSTTTRSYAGAQGPMQFMPGTFRAYAVDGNGDGVTDINNVEDAVYSAANYLAAGGAAEGNIDAALFNYNHAQWYVDKVKGVAIDAGMPQ